MQVKLLRVLQDRKFRRLGGTEEVQADIRVIAATNQDLPKRVEEGKFREDLFYRINVISVELPPLRERREDIPLLAEHFLSKFGALMQKPVLTIAHETMDLLMAHEWRGNVRELENVIERAVALEQTPAILPESLPGSVLRGTTAINSGGSPATKLPEEGIDLEAHVDQIYRAHIAQALERAGGVQVKAADMLGMSFRSFRYYARKFNIR
jgi:two-component system, NtrC family, response regulator PilR